MGRAKKCVEEPALPLRGEDPAILATISQRDRARYPIHDLRHKATDAKTGREIEVVDCAAALILPGQVPLRGADLADLFCVGCGRVVPSAPEIVERAREAARAEGFEARDVADAPLTPGAVSHAGRAALYWALRLERSAGDDATRAMARVAIGKAHGELERLGLLTSELLTHLGRELASKITDPEVDRVAISRTDDPALAPKSREKRASRKVVIARIVPRCGNVSCFSPCDRDGSCTGGCGYIEKSGGRIEEIRRCWDVVDAKAPAKTARTKNIKASVVAA